ncbi:protein OXIDATIVE STRESS 3 LIKE 2-like [Miscanthus floridulus]|uniref:protein OXIDATIVE STRESS 3 LIKE 2-like n=1 Tax=Miscanthus floridulus TaxID=154761 RepID=UPI0034589283
MSVVAAVGPGAAAAAAGAYGHGQPLCGGGGARKRKDVGVVQDQEAEAPAGLRGSDRVAAAPRRAAGLFVLETVEEEADADAERSSIGAVSDDEEEDGEEVNSGGTSTAAGRKGGALASMDMDALDDALPIKRGLSNFFSGKSRSFANLQDAASAVTSARDLAKPENPFNKRRRVLRCCSIRRVASTSLSALPPFFLPPTTDGSTGNDGGRSG